MFKFSFDVDESDDERTTARAPAAAAPTRAPGPSHTHTLADLLSTLPDVISYSPLPHPSGGAPLLRRDLYDARFQVALAPETTADAAADGDTDAYIDADTDLIPGTYEGGLKSWEGGVDLVEVISRATCGGEAGWVRGARVLELGCGTGLPSAYLLRCVLEAPASPNEEKTVIHVQDYNLPVLSLVTLPNLILAALPSLPASARGAAEAAPLPKAPKAAVPEGTIMEEDEDAADGDEGEWEDEDAAPRPFDPVSAGTLELTPALLDAFTTLLEERGVELRFTSGDWGGMAQSVGTYQLVLSAETIYSEDSVAPLLEVIRAATGSASQKRDGGEKKEMEEEDLEASLGALQIDDFARAPLRESGPVILIAAKILYFGVGGGLDDFLEQVEALGGWSARVRDWVRGVGRAVVRIGW